MSFRREDYEYGYDRDGSGKRKSSRDWSPHRRSRHEGESSSYYAGDMQSRSRSSGSSGSRRLNSRHGQERSPDNTRRYYISKRVESHHGRERGGPPSPGMEGQERRRGLFSCPPVERAELPARRKRSYSSSSSESGSEERLRRRERELRRRKPRRSSLSQTKETDDANREAKSSDRKRDGEKSKKERRKKKGRKQSSSSSSSSSSSDSDSSSSSSASSSSLSSDSDHNKSKKRKSKKKKNRPVQDKKQSKDKKPKICAKTKPVIWTKPQDSSGDDSIPSPLLRRDKSEPKEITTAEAEDAQIIGPVPVDAVAVDSKRLAPMTKEEWDKRQSVVRREVSPTTGRSRLIKGDGEVIEEIVSRERHKEINRLATRADGKSFQDGLKKIM